MITFVSTRERIAPDPQLKATARHDFRGWLKNSPWIAMFLPTLFHFMHVALHALDDGVSKRLTLKMGSNLVRCAIVNGSGASDFCARFLDKDDKALKGFTLNIGTTKEP